MFSWRYWINFETLIFFSEETNERTNKWKMLKWNVAYTYVQMVNHRVAMHRTTGTKWTMNVIFIIKYLPIIRHEYGGLWLSFSAAELSKIWNHVQETQKLYRTNKFYIRFAPGLREHCCVSKSCALLRLFFCSSLPTYVRHGFNCRYKSFKMVITG